jgi:hypothetical protein
MKNRIILMPALFLMLFPAVTIGEDFLGAPVLPHTETIQKTETRLKILSDLTHDDALAFYREALREEEDIKFRDWKDATYIEDDGNRQWHSVTISKEGKGGTEVIIRKDSWTWIMGTLILRYLGVFVVLLLLFLGLKISGVFISRAIGKMDAKKDES